MDQRTIPDNVSGIVTILFNVIGAYDATIDDHVLGPHIRKYVGELLERAVVLNNKAGV
jgi:hypothetical protein